MKVFDLFYNCVKVGHVFVIQRGLYYNIKCSARERCINRVHLIAISENGPVDLGICSQSNEVLRLERILPVKYVGEYLRQFYIQPDHACLKVDVFEDRPFLFIENLKNAVIHRSKDGIAIAFR